MTDIAMQMMATELPKQLTRFVTKGT
jgi:hypothetical protein